MTSADTIMKWTDFDKEPSVELIKGKIEVRRAKHLRINGILVVSSYIMVHKVGDTLKIFDLKSFIVSEYDLSDPKQPPVLTKNLFVDKAALVFLSAPFFKTKNKFLGFLKVVEKPFSKKLQAQAEAQTNVLKRALASVEEENKEAALKKTAEEAKLKKVRELFFYRTFYR
ncbi:MAG: hypothetical protein H7256_13210 [Bdellovibrio sp.]|nr:hypothetical protein [Bdellovibrio sp.]